MKIFLFNQFFWPDAAATSQLLTDLARGLKDRGHEVHAFCADGGYAIQDQSNNPQVFIHRVKAMPFVRGKLGRAFSYGSFLFSSVFYGLFAPKADVIVTLTTPPLLSLIGTLIKKVRGGRHFIWEMDVYPDVAVDLNYIKPGGFIDRFTGALVDFSRRQADGILALGTCMRRRLMRRGIPESIIQVADNWADGELIYPSQRAADAESFTLLYSGNLGLAHDSETIATTMETLAADARFHFVFAGGGARRRDLEERCRNNGVQNVEFRSYREREKLGDSLGACEAGLITQRAICVGSVVPSKIYGLMAAGRPIVFIGPRDSTVAEIIQQFKCGWQIDNGDAASLTGLLRYLAGQPQLVQLAGQRARCAFEQHYDLPIGVERICSLIGASTPLKHNRQAVPANDFDLTTTV